MVDLWRRWNERTRELERGVDADLVESNRRRYQVSVGSIALGAAIIFLSSKAALGPWVVGAAGFLGAAFCIVGIIGLNWAHAERRFLHKPDAEVQPRLDK